MRRASAMALAAAASLLLAAPLAAAPVNERSLFHIPGVEDFRIQRIFRSDREREWPFSVESGYLMCAWVFGQRAVFFSEEPAEDARDDEYPRTITVSTDPFDLAFGNLGSRDLMAETEGLEKLIPLMAPFERLGRSLCDQPRGAEIGPGEL